MLPLLLAIPVKLGFDLLSTCRYFHALVFGFTIYFAGFLCWKILHRIWSAFIGSAVVLTSCPMSFTCLLVWSEPLFNLLVLLVLLFFKRYLESGKLRDILLLSAFAALACLQRYGGAIVIITTFWCIVLLKVSYPLRKRLIVGIASCAAAALPITLWCMRNYIETNTLSGGRGKSNIALGQSINQMLNTITGWLCPLHMQWSTRLLVLSTIIIVLFCIYRLIRPTRNQSTRETPSGIFIPVFFVCIYLAFILLMETIIAFDPINDRLLSPVFVPIILLRLAGIDKILVVCGRHYKKICFSTVMAIIIWIVIVPVTNSWEVLPSMHREGTSFSYINKDWNSSPLVAWLKAIRSRV